ncbi:MAG TPA: ATP-binding cassette domain-containing protein [Anaerolineales bacterium]
MTSLVEVRDLWYAYPALAGVAPEWVLRGVNLHLGLGEVVGLMGATGAGKSTLALALNGSVPQSTGGQVRGEVLIEGLDSKRHPVAELATRVGIVFQDPATQFLQTTVEAEVAFGPENLGLPVAELEQRVSWALRVTGLVEFRQRAPAHLSGGEQQRVAIAAILAMRPRILVFDEPTASLDPGGKLEVLEVIRTLRSERTILLITQDSEALAGFADRVLVLDHGQIVMEGNPVQVFEQVERLGELGLRPPEIWEFARCLNEALGASVFGFADVEQAVAALRQAEAA